MTPPPTIQQDPPPTGDAKRKPARNQRTIQVPYSPTEWALVQASFPMTETEWQQMIAVLEAMKLGLVAPPESA
jgi:hypothetical protein